MIYVQERIPSDFCRYSYERPVSCRVIVESGYPEAFIYHPVIDKSSGHFELEIDQLQRKHIYEEIQSYKDSVDLHKIIERFRAGDADVLSRVQGFYADLTAVPHNIFEAMEMQQRVSEHFASLPPEVKERFGNNPMQYTLQAGTDEWFAKMHIDKADVQPEVKEELKNES